jgi:predicted amidophosphoribosyltransferase
MSYKPLPIDTRCWDCGKELNMHSCLALKGPQTNFRLYNFCGYKCALAWLAEQYVAWQSRSSEQKNTAKSG